jgi:hypothetical protein
MNLRFGLLERRSKLLDKYFYLGIKMAQSGAGAEVTALAESLQAYACATRQFLGKDLEDITQVNSKTILDADCDRTLKQCISGLDAEWYHSVIVTANKIFKDFGITGKNYKFYRGGKLVGQIYKEFGRFRKESGISGDDKWNPADIWMAKKDFKFEDEHNSLTEYNRYIYDQYQSGKLVGISLKKIPKGAATSKVYNDGKPPAAEFKVFKLGPNMGDSKDIYIQYNSEGKDGEIQLRNFSSRAVTSSWQGEIKGKTAAGGKIGGGVLISLAEECGVSGLTKPSSFGSNIDKPSDKVFDTFAKMFKELSGVKTSVKDLTLEAKMNQKRDKVWWMSKYLGLSYCYAIQKSGKEDIVTKAIFGYGSSATKNSSIFIKYS